MTETGSLELGPTSADNGDNCQGERDSALSPQRSPWRCHTCTFQHSDQHQALFLSCQICGTLRGRNSTTCTTDDGGLKTTQSTCKSPLESVADHFVSRNDTKALPVAGRKDVTSPFPKQLATKENMKRTRSSSASSWGSLRPPTERDIRGKRRCRKALDALPRCYEHLVVLDFEWTADNIQKMVPTAEITQFPSVVLQIVEKKRGQDLDVPPVRSCRNVPSLPADLVRPLSSSNGDYWRRDALAISAFDTFVRPTFNPILTDFSIRLTGITQAQVDASPTVNVALDQYMEWLQSLGLVDNEGYCQGHWCFVTWGDGDIMQTLRRELEYKSVRLPPCFDRWINLKSNAVFAKHYGREPRGGLRSCVESVGAKWEGRAHNGLVDSFNTAKIVRHMVQTGFLFTRATRGLDKNGRPFGQKRR